MHWKPSRSWCFQLLTLLEPFQLLTLLEPLTGICHLRTLLPSTCSSITQFSTALKNTALN